jgi:hypothetical protein
MSVPWLLLATVFFACGDDGGEPVSSQSDGIGRLSIGDETWVLDVEGCPERSGSQFLLNARTENGAGIVTITRSGPGSEGHIHDRVEFLPGDGRTLWSSDNLSIDGDGVVGPSLMFTGLYPVEDERGSVEASCP